MENTPDDRNLLREKALKCIHEVIINLFIFFCLRAKKDLLMILSIISIVSSKSQAAVKPYEMMLKTVSITIAYISSYISMSRKDYSINLQDHRIVQIMNADYETKP